MNAKKMRKKIAASRRARMQRERAVSPVVATLILILVAVAAAAALYLWLVAWQGNVTGGIGQPTAQSTLSIGGSTSVYPFSSYAVTQFEQNNSDVVVSNNQGGTGAGLAAVCTGQVDIGAASAPEVLTTLQSADGCPATATEQTVAYDGVDAIVASNNAHGLISLSWDTVQAIYTSASTSTTAVTGSNLHGPELGNTQIDGVTGAGIFVPAVGTGYEWGQIPACAITAAATPCATAPTEAVDAHVPAVVAGGGAACAAPYANDICDLTSTTGTPCGFVVCAGGTVANPATNSIQVWARQEVSGTTQSFISRLMAVGASGTTPTGIGFSGCSGDNQFDGCGMAFSHLGTGNPAVIAGVAASPDALGYASDGLAQTTGSGVVPVNFEGFGQTTVVVIVGESTALKAIASGIAAGTTGNYGAQSYVGWRPFVYIETSPPTGEELRYIQFVMDPANNENFAAESAEISVYASGLAGVVPVSTIA